MEEFTRQSIVTKSKKYTFQAKRGERWRE